jgi:dTDP-4-amino-4,6-dideoxygalactose transaminase
MAEAPMPYGRHEIDDDDIAAAVAVLRSDWLTTGPMVERFEGAFAAYVGVSHAVAVSNGTAALHLAMLAADIGPGDEVIVPALTFAASANCVRYAGGTVVFADVREDTLTVDPAHVASLVTPRKRRSSQLTTPGLRAIWMSSSPSVNATSSCWWRTPVTPPVPSTGDGKLDPSHTSPLSAFIP